MIPSQNIIAWGNLVPWPEQRQVEQDLIISRAVVEQFNDDFLMRELRFRGGTALNKLHFPAPVRYSEDIDLVRTTHGEIKPIPRRTREVLEPWLGNAAFKHSGVGGQVLTKEHWPRKESAGLAVEPTRMGSPEKQSAGRCKLILSRPDPGLLRMTRWPRRRTSGERAASESPRGAVRHMRGTLQPRRLPGHSR